MCAAKRCWSVRSEFAQLRKRSPITWKLDEGEEERVHILLLVQIRAAKSTLDKLINLFNSRVIPLSQHFSAAYGHSQIHFPFLLDHEKPV